MASTNLQTEIEELSTLITDTRTNNYAQLASLAIVFYDYILTFDDEINLVWRQSWSIGKALFFLNRYSGIFALAFNSSISTIHCPIICFHWVRYQVGSSIIAFWLVDLILALRVWALWARSKWLLLFLCLLFAATLGTSATLAAEVFRFITVMHRPGPFAPGCFPMGFPKYTYAIAIPEISNSGVLLLLTLYRTVSTVRKGRRNAPLYFLVIKDGVLYYLCIMFILLMNAFAFSSFAITAAASGLAVAIPCTFGSRILLNLRKQLRQTDQMGAGTAPTLDTMNFNADRVETEEHSLGGISSVNQSPQESQPSA
ncbi:hypothetical protein SCHPADRAFT_21269 [Schizopora paradoxa]|uniref:DUF6533 domain-containing protein n=1 Tax=Schizopora paradoxa TaxID=27342 RepID=A0A0H2SFY5_9AGAM|nr:hypothetical protein SCHPADRAFT_21269 [Schizopora paradoxa]